MHQTCNPNLQMSLGSDACGGRFALQFSSVEAGICKKQQGRRDLACNLILKPGILQRTIWVLSKRHENCFPATLLQPFFTAVDTFFFAIAGLEEQVSNLQEALADAKSASEQAASSQQAAETGAAQAQELRREVADLRKTLDDRQTELESIKVCTFVLEALLTQSVLHQVATCI